VRIMSAIAAASSAVSVSCQRFLMAGDRVAQGANWVDDNQWCDSGHLMKNTLFYKS
jgi:hypothetical protein